MRVQFIAAIRVFFNDFRKETMLLLIPKCRLIKFTVTKKLHVGQEPAWENYVEMIWVLQEYNKLPLGQRMMLESQEKPEYPKFDIAAHGSQVEITKFMLGKIEAEDPIFFISVDRKNMICYHLSSDSGPLENGIVEMDHPGSFFNLILQCGAEERARLSDTNTWDIALALINNDSRLGCRAEDTERALIHFLSTHECPAQADDQRLRVVLLQQLNSLRGVTMVERFLHQSDALESPGERMLREHIHEKCGGYGSSYSISSRNSYIHCNNSREFQPARRGRQIRIRQKMNELVTNEENCALYVKNVHPMASAQEILDVVKTGSIANYAYYGPHGRHRTAAVKIVFFNRESAYNFLLQSNSVQGLHIKGLRIQAFWNIGKVGPCEQNGSRVIQVFGPANELSARRLLDFYDTKFEFVLVHTKEWMVGDEMKVVEIGFGSLKPQAEWACMSFPTFLRDNGLSNSHFTIEYALDPCDPMASLEFFFGGN